MFVALTRNAPPLKSLSYTIQLPIRRQASVEAHPPRLFMLLQQRAASAKTVIRFPSEQHWLRDALSIGTPRLIVTLIFGTFVPVQQVSIKRLLLMMRPNHDPLSQRGVRLERLACDLLRERGDTVTPHCAHVVGASVRSAGSKGVIDLAAIP